MRTIRTILRTMAALRACSCRSIPQRLASNRLKTLFASRVVNKLWSHRPLNVSGNDTAAASPEPEGSTPQATELPSWETIVASANEVVKVAQESLSAAAREFNVTERIEDLESTFHDILASSSEIRGHMAELAQHGLTLDHISDELGVIFAGTLVCLGETFPPSDQAPSHMERQQMVTAALDEAERGFLDLARKHGMSEGGLEGLRESFGLLKPQIGKLVVITGDLIEQHPVLFSTLISSAAGMLISESWILRPLLSLMGYGPYGPVEGTPAAWAQRQFWGAVVDKGSWFAILQKAGITGLSVHPIAGVIGGTIGTLLRKPFH